MDQCLSRVLQVGAHPVDGRILCEDHCGCPDFFWCQRDDFTAGYHPFKSVGNYANCMANALHGEPAPPGSSAASAPSVALSSPNASSSVSPAAVSTAAAPAYP